MDKYSLIKRIGKGSFGEVFYSKNLETNEDVAIKKMELNLSNKNIIETEIKILGVLSCDIDNILCYIDYFVKGRYIYIVTKYINNSKELTEIRNEDITIEKKIDIMIQLTRSLQLISEKGILHLDLKPENILYNKELDTYVTTIIDFGFACILSENITSAVYSCKNVSLRGTPNYISPDIIANPRNIDYKSDIYSLGWVFYYILTYSIRSKLITDIVEEPKLSVKFVYKFITTPQDHNILVDETKKELLRLNIDLKLSDIICGMIDLDPKLRFDYNNIIKRLKEI